MNIGFSKSEIPEERTIEYRLAKLKPADPSAPWTVADASGDEAALVLPVLAAVIEQTDGRTSRVSRDLAEWIIRVRRAAPDLPIWNVYAFARAYLGAVQRKEPTEALDQLLAIAPSIIRDPSAWTFPRIVKLVPGAGEFSPALITSPELRQAIMDAGRAARAAAREWREKGGQK